MFRKIVSNLPFSPALIGQLGFYAKRLRKEEVTRKLGLFFMILALLVQSLAVFQPSESANAASSNDMVYGGIGQSLNNFLSAYDANTKHLKDVMNYVGITRTEIASARYSSWTAGDKLSWGFNPHFSYSKGERTYSIVNAQGYKVTTAYSRPLKLWTGSRAKINGWFGYSKSIGWFGLMQDCGNLVTDKAPTPRCVYNNTLTADAETCKPCPGNKTLWINDPVCTPNITKSKTATNISQGYIDASSITAKAGDQISYTITVKNTGLNTTSYGLQDSLADALEYATLTDSGGGTLDKTTGILSWSTINLDAKEEQTRTFVIKVLDPIPATAQGKSNGTSYDCLMTNTFGNSIGIKIDCPVPKAVEQVTTQLPKTGPTDNLIFAGLTLAIVAFFYARTRQVKKEVYLIRRDVVSGTI